MLCKQWRIDNALLSAFHKDRDGRILYESEPPRRERVIPAEQAHTMSSMLSAVIQEGTGKRLINNYGLNIPLAGKNRDNPESSRWLVYWL